MKYLVKIVKSIESKSVIFLLLLLLSSRLILANQAQEKQSIDVVHKLTSGRFQSLTIPIFPGNPIEIEEDDTEDEENNLSTLICILPSYINFSLFLEVKNYFACIRKFDFFKLKTSKTPLNILHCTFLI